GGWQTGDTADLFATAANPPCPINTLSGRGPAHVDIGGDVRSTTRAHGSGKELAAIIASRVRPRDVSVAEKADLASQPSRLPSRAAIPRAPASAGPTRNAPCRFGAPPGSHPIKNQPRGDAGLATAAIGPVAAPRAEAQTTLALENTPMSDVIQALASGRVTATALTKGYLARIEAYDRDGPKLNSVRELNADALTIAGKLDDAKPSVEQPLAGVPILVKDNIATGDKQPTTAGSLALKGARARGDAIVVRLLRGAGAVILGKANLTEFANILAIDMPSGYSSLGGQV